MAEGENDEENGEGGRPVLFRCADRFGHEVIVYHDRWYDHVMDEHGELANREDAVRETLAAAEHVRRDRFRANRSCYYRLDALPQQRHRYLKVVVEFADTPFGRVGTFITAFAVDRLDAREASIW